MKIYMVSLLHRATITRHGIIKTKINWIAHSTTDHFIMYNLHILNSSVSKRVSYMLRTWAGPLADTADIILTSTNWRKDFEFTWNSIKQNSVIFECLKEPNRVWLLGVYGSHMTWCTGSLPKLPESDCSSFLVGCRYTRSNKLFHIRQVGGVALYLAATPR